MKKPTKYAKKPAPGMLGKGMAKKAASQMKNRKKDLDEKIRKAGG